MEKTNDNNWRQREQFALQLSEFATLISAEKLNKFYLPKFFDLCLDNVAQVREVVSTKATAPILWKLLSHGK
jgi:hypothetical protein